MKPIHYTCCLLLIALTVLTTASVQSQSILFERSRGKLRVNGEVIRAKDLPESLPDMEKAAFSMRMTGPFPMRVEINGIPYEVWEDSITEGGTSGNVHFRMSMEADGTFSIASSASADLHGLASTLSQEIEGAFTSIAEMGLWDSLGSALHSFAHLQGDDFDFEVPSSLSQMPQRMAPMRRDATRMLEFSNYLTSVRDAGGELFELLRHEWREEAEAAELARKIRRLERGADREEAIEALRRKLEEIFSMKQENRRMEIKHLEMELERMEERLRERSEAKDRLIDARLDELLESSE